MRWVLEPVPYERGGGAEMKEGYNGNNNLEQIGFNVNVKCRNV